MLKSINLDKVETIGAGAFRDCENLNFEKFGKMDLLNIKTIGASAFRNCKFSYEILLGKVETIGVSAFHNCQYLKRIDLSSIENADAIEKMHLRVVD